MPLKIIALIVLILELILLACYLLSLNGFNDQLPIILWLVLLVGFLHYTYYQKPIKYFTSIGIGLFLTIILGQTHFFLAGDNCSYDELNNAYCAMPIANLLLSVILTPIVVGVFILTYKKLALSHHKYTHWCGYAISFLISILCIFFKN